jgi:uncharacterized protein YjaG (DUF416 family)
MNLRKIIGEEALLIRRNFYNELFTEMSKRFNSNFEDNDESYLTEGTLGKDFYDSIATKGYDPEELFTIRIPISLMTDNAQAQIKKINKTASIEAEVPIDISVVDKLMREYIEAKTTNIELFNKYQNWANWYIDFNNLIFESLPESDACLFLAAVAFSSANTSLDQNIVEASKLFLAVKTDFNRGNAGKQILAFIAKNINSISTDKDLQILSKLVNVNSSYARLLFPKQDPNFVAKRKDSSSKVNEIKLSRAKLGNYNKFVKYYLEKDGKLSKQQVIQDLKNGNIEIAGSKIYSFLINLIDPEFQWKSVDGIVIEPATIDTWMVQIFFNKPVENLVMELQRDEIIDPGRSVSKNLVSLVIKDLASSDKTRSAIVKVLNDEAKKYGMKVHQLQAFTWVKFREEKGVEVPQFSSFKDVMTYIQKLEDRIETINPELSFIKKIGNNAKSKTRSVLATITLLSKMTRWSPKHEDEVEKTLKNVRQFYPDLSRDDSAKLSKPSEKQNVIKYFIALKNNGEDNWSTNIRTNSKNKKDILHSVVGNSMKDVINKSKAWIISHTPPNKNVKIKVEN